MPERIRHSCEFENLPLGSQRGGTSLNFWRRAPGDRQLALHARTTMTEIRAVERVRPRAELYLPGVLRSRLRLELLETGVALDGERVLNRADIVQRDRDDPGRGGELAGGEGVLLGA